MDKGKEVMLDNKVCLHQHPTLQELLLSYNTSKPGAEERSYLWLHRALDKAADAMKHNRNYRERDEKLEHWSTPKKEPPVVTAAAKHAVKSTFEPKSGAQPPPAAALTERDQSGVYRSGDGRKG